MPITFYPHYRQTHSIRLNFSFERACLALSTGSFDRVLVARTCIPLPTCPDVAHSCPGTTSSRTHTTGACPHPHRSAPTAGGTVQSHSAQHSAMHAALATQAIFSIVWPCSAVSTHTSCRRCLRAVIALRRTTSTRSTHLCGLCRALHGQRDWSPSA